MSVKPALGAIHRARDVFPWGRRGGIPGIVPAPRPRRKGVDIRVGRL